MKISLVILFMLGTQAGMGQPAHAGARSAAMGNVSVVFTDANSLMGNQAGLAFADKLAGIASAERRFMLSELQTLSVGLSLPTKSGNFGFTIQRFGFEGFRQQQLGLVYARRLFENFAIGSRISYLQTRIPDYGAKGLLSFEAGLLAVLDKQFLIGAHLANPARIELVEKESLPTVFKLGAGYAPSSKAMAVFELEKDIDFPMRLRGGVEYRPVEQVRFRVGYGSNPASFSFGLAIGLNKNFSADAAASYHQTLGFTPACSIMYTKS